MRLLTAAANVDVATTNYPNGRTRNKVGETPGTISDEILNGDGQQLFQKLIIDAGITPNGLPDNVADGYQLLTALVAKINSTVKAVGEIGTTIVAIKAGFTTGTTNYAILSKAIDVVAIQMDFDFNSGGSVSDVEITLDNAIAGAVLNQNITCFINGVINECVIVGLTPFIIQMPGVYNSGNYVVKIGGSFISPNLS